MVKINGKKINTEGNNNITVMQACMINNLEIPHFCYHEKLSIAGNCRMCLVEVKGAAKPIASCATPLLNNMDIYTNSKLVHKAREGVLEFLLCNHPLDCPICDQGGECDLQDQALIFGSDRGRFYEDKRSVEQKNIGSIVKTFMTRCIHCTRCVRFSREIGGFDNLGVTGRGSKSEIGTYIDHILFNTEVSGNVVDLCPVGALTSKAYAFKARPWELKSKNTIDFSNSYGVSVRVDYRGTDIMRVLPLSNDKLNEDWISDRCRFFFDGLENIMLKTPLHLKGIDDHLLKDKGITYKYVNLDWHETYRLIYRYYVFMFNRNVRIVPILGDLIDVESVIILRTLIHSLGQNMKVIESNYSINNSNDFRQNYVYDLNSFKDFDFLFLISSNLRLENPMLNLKLKKVITKNKVLCFNIGSKLDVGFNLFQISNNVKDCINFLEGKSKLCLFYKNSLKPLIIGGESLYYRSDSLLHSLKSKFLNRILVLNKNRSFFCTNELGFNNVGKYETNKYGFRREALLEVPWDRLHIEHRQNLGIFIRHPASLYYHIGHNNMSMKKQINFVNNDFEEEVFHIFHGNLDPMLIKEKKINYNLILPGRNLMMKKSLFFNSFGSIQESKPIFSSQDYKNKGEEDWLILNGIIVILRRKYNFDFRYRVDLINRLERICNIYYFKKQLDQKFNYKKNLVNFKVDYVISNKVNSYLNYNTNKLENWDISSFSVQSSSYYYNNIDNKRNHNFFVNNSRVSLFYTRMDNYIKNKYIY